MPSARIGGRRRYWVVKRHDTFMPSGGPKKTWQQITRSEIIASLIASTVIGGVVVAACVRSLVVRDLGAMAFLPASGILFVVAALGVCYVKAIRELRRRQKV